MKQGGGNYNGGGAAGGRATATAALLVALLLVVAASQPHAGVAAARLLAPQPPALATSAAGSSKSCPSNCTNNPNNPSDRIEMFARSLASTPLVCNIAAGVPLPAGCNLRQLARIEALVLRRPRAPRLPRLFQALQQQRHGPVRPMGRLRGVLPARRRPHAAAPEAVAGEEAAPTKRRRLLADATTPTKRRRLW
uniref:Bifunctional inhibitor/plant lipid transfer protein/seed storage helical domain-containing protein n=1 Tax=Oryza glumipatula TaxID=40148 RepID=A0A0E0B2N2_9ORYZ